MSPFIKTSAVEALLAEHSIPNIRVLTRFNLADCRDRVSDLAALRMLLDRGAQIRGVRGLHSKLYIFDDRSAIVGSVNLTLAALRTNHEIGVIVRNTSPVKDCSAYFDDIWGNAGRCVTRRQLDVWQRELDEAAMRDKKRGSATHLNDYGAKVDRQLEELLAVAVARTSDRQVFVKIFGKDDNRAPLESSISETIRENGSHWACAYPKGRRPRGPRDGDIMYFARMVAPNDYRIYGRGLVLQHVPGRDDASDNELKKMPWKRRWPHYVRVHDAEFIDGTLGDGVSLFHMLNELDTAAFATTTAKRRSGIEANPRLSIRQRPDIRLAPAGATWLEAQFDRRVEEHGAIAREAVESFDIPASAVWLPQQGKVLLELLIDRIEQGEIDVEDPDSYPTYLDVARLLGIADASWPGLGNAVRRHGLDELDSWVRRFRLPAISGFFVYADSRRPGEKFFELHGRLPSNERWWRSQLRASIAYHWRDLIG